MKTRCMIVDDEPLAIEVIENHLQKFQDMEITATCSDAVQAFEIIKRKPVDLMFLDIQMPQMTGIDFLKNIKHAPKVIITTAYRDYALQGYELDVVDYLLKPISFDRFLKAVNKYYQHAANDIEIFQTPDAAARLNDLFIYVKTDKKIAKILLNDIMFIESIKDYVKIKCREKTIITKNTLSHFEEKLPGDLFIRIHRSFIISISKIDAFTATTIEIGKEEFPIGKTYKNEVLKTLNWQENRG